MRDIAIRVRGLSKQYRIGVLRRRRMTLRDQLGEGFSTMLWRRARAPYDDSAIWALRDVSFDVRRGETVGVIGRNGAGKSTLLKILARIVAPSSGRAEIHGRTGSILEVGTGFHPELTGRENIYLSSAILGMKKREVDRKLDEIIAFSEIEQFLETPVKRYSTGMYIRLAFAVAAHLETDIILVDEVLAVGDGAFQAKCMGKMAALAAEGRTIFFVSHNLAAVQSLCHRGLLVRRGNVALDATAEAAVREYLASLTEASGGGFAAGRDHVGSGRVRLAGARILTGLDLPGTHLEAGSPAVFEFTYQNPGGAKACRLAFTIVNQLGVAATACDTAMTNGASLPLGESGTFRCVVPNLPLPIGQYSVAVTLETEGRLSDAVPNALTFDVVSSAFFPNGRSPQMAQCSCMVAHEWTHEVA
jgi:lipopolysaccharide transport system ATP-binding protein